MNVSNITAVSAIVIAVASLVVSLMEARITRRHNRHSVRPILQIDRFKKYGDEHVGLRLRNVGIGPAIIVSTTVILDGTAIGEWDYKSLELMTGPEIRLPKYTTLYKDSAIPAGYDAFLVHIDGFDEKPHGWFWELIAYRLSIEIKYQSIYGDETFMTFKRPRQRLAQASS